MPRKTTKYLTSIRHEIEDSREAISNMIGDLEHDVDTLKLAYLVRITEAPDEWDRKVRDVQNWLTAMQKHVTNIKTETKKYREFFV